MDSGERIDRLALVVKGQVQGVGFRPFVWRLATGLGLSGFALNALEGVRIEVQGPAGALAEFRQRLAADAPPLARIASLECRPLPPGEDSGFAIRHSEGGGGSEILVSPDVAVCAECLEEILQPGNRRFGYAFANCVNCGPRFTITRGLPYDRAETVMACFSLCPDCASEYSNPADRRFHAQPIACAACGPRLWFMEKPPAGVFTPPDDPDALDKAASLIISGKILALKGLGGFQLVCDARNGAAVALLRRRKQRPHKALAVMAASLEDAALFCRPAPAAERLLTGPEKPVTLCPKLPGAPRPLDQAISPDSHAIGVMLPYTPLHALLLDRLAAKGLEHPVIVATSANPAGEPICLGNREALSRLAHLADGWLLHDRDILCRVDDSVAAIPALPGGEPGVPMLIRRARGYTPAPVPLGDGHSSCVLGAGAELKAAICLTRGGDAFPGQHIGDLKSPKIFEFYRESLAHMRSLLRCQPEAVVCDLHPDFISSRFARELADERGIPLWRLQHHAAHAAAVLAENDVFTPALALCLDGFGLGPEGALWGGELLRVDLSRPAWERLGGLSGIPLPGGDQASREPWRIARALAMSTGKAASLSKVAGRPASIVDEMLAAGLNCPLSSSCGRLFDGAAALLGLCDKITYEGQAPMILESRAWEWLAKNGAPGLPRWSSLVSKKDGLFVLETIPLIADLQDFISATSDAPKAAAAFHLAIASGLAALCAAAAARSGLCRVGLSGGVMQNGLLAALLPELLREAGLEPLCHVHLPPGDACVSLGQAVWGRALLNAEDMHRLLE